MIGLQKLVNLENYCLESRVARQTDALNFAGISSISVHECLVRINKLYETR